MVNHNKKFVFFHITKTGGSSITQYFKNIGILHKDFNYGVNIHYENIDQEIINNYFKFAFHRNPWDRMVSTWKFFTTINPLRHKILKKYPECINFHDYCAKLVEITNILPHKEAVHFLNQSDINGYSKYLQLDFWGRFSYLQADFLKVCNYLELKPRILPHVNSSHHSNYKVYYNQKTKNLVSKLYEKDIDIFKYTFDN